MPVEYYFLATAMGFFEPAGWASLCWAYFSLWNLCQSIAYRETDPFEINFIPKETILGVSQA